MSFVGGRHFARLGARQWFRRLIICLACASLPALVGQNRAHAEPTSSLFLLLNGKRAQVQVCNDSIISASVCEEIASAITEKRPELVFLSPESEVPDSNDGRMAALGHSCAPSGADLKGDPYLPFELEFDGWQAVPSGPFQIFTIGDIFPRWRGYKIVTAAGYDYENTRISTGHPLSWKGYYAIQVSQPCPVVLLAALYHRGREQTSPKKVGDNLLAWGGRILLVSAEEQPTTSDSYYVNVLQLPEDPVAGVSTGKAAATHILSFIAQ